MRPNGLPEIRSLLPLVRAFSKATVAVQKAGEAAGLEIVPSPSSPAAGLLSVTGKSGLPVHPQQSEIRFRRKLADQARKPKAKASDDPALLRDEAERWLRQLTNSQARTYLAVLDGCDPDAQRRRELASRAPAAVKADPLPRLRDLILHARRKYLDYLGTNTQPVVFRAVMREVAGRYEWQEIRRAMVVHFAEQREIIRKIKAFNDADSERLEAERIRAANLAAQGIVIVRLPTDPRAIEGARQLPKAAPAAPPAAQGTAPGPGAVAPAPAPAPVPGVAPAPAVRGQGR